MAASLGRTRVLIERFLSHDYMPAAVGLLILAAAAALVSAQTPDGPAVSQRARALHSGALLSPGALGFVSPGGRRGFGEPPAPRRPRRFTTRSRTALWRAGLRWPHSCRGSRVLSLWRHWRSETRRRVRT